MRGEEGVVICDGCWSVNLTGRRFKCLVCCDLDLCGSCYDTAPHAHPMQCLLSKKDLSVYFGENSKKRTQSLTCPICGFFGFSAEGLMCHVSTEHGTTHSQVCCPLCVATRHYARPPFTQHLSSHLQRDHSLGRGVRDIVALLEEPTGRVVNRRNDFRTRFPDSVLEDSFASSTPVGQTADTVDQFSQVIGHISSRCAEIGPESLARLAARSSFKAATAPCDQKAASSQTAADYSDRFISRNLQVSERREPDRNFSADISHFVCHLLLGSLNCEVPSTENPETTGLNRMCGAFGHIVKEDEPATNSKREKENKTYFNN